MGKEQWLEFLQGQLKEEISIIRRQGEKKKRRITLKDDTFFEDGGSGMICLALSSLTISVVGASADGQTWKHFQWRKAVCGQVIIYQMGATWGRVPHMCKMGWVMSWIHGLFE